MVGAMTSGSIINTYSESFTLVMSSNTKPPVKRSALRRNTEMDEPTTVCSKVVSVVMRAMRSPVRDDSK